MYVSLQQSLRLFSNADKKELYILSCLILSEMLLSRHQSSFCATLELPKYPAHYQTFLVTDRQEKNSHELFGIKKKFTHDTC